MNRGYAETGRTMTDREVLVKARALIKRGWTSTQDFARTRSGRGCSPDAPNAARWCALGALIAASGDHSPIVGARLALQKQVSHSSIGAWNSAQPSKRPILAAFDRAIEAVS
jgi:hypothetical protein